MRNAALSGTGLWACAALAGYCFGCLSMAWIVGFLRGIDIKKSGNGNAGASNALMVLGVAPGIVTAAWDIGKAALAYWFMAGLFHAPHGACMLAAGMAVIGHCFPFWLDFDGGKGFAPFIGFMLCCDWRAAMLPLALGLVLGIALDRIVAMTFTCAALWPFLMAAAYGWEYGLWAAALSALLFWRHRENIRKLAEGTEPGIRAAFHRRDNIQY